MTTANDILNVARKYVGSVEGGANHAHILAVYNNTKPLPVGYKVSATDSWCATFVSFCAIEAGNANLFGRECSVPRFITIFKSKGIWFEDGNMVPKPGDIVCFNWDDSTQPNDGNPDHIGFVEKVEGRTITTIEGNASNKVGRRVMAVGAGYIRGYARPSYSGQSVTPPTAGKTMARVAQEVINGSWGNNPSRSAKLAAAGYNAAAVQAEVNRLLKGGKPSTPVAPKPQPSSWHAETGKFRLNTAIQLRSGASTSSSLIATLPAGSVIHYNAYMHSGGYVWVRQPRGNGYGYLATGVSVNGKRQNYWGSFS